MKKIFILTLIGSMFIILTVLTAEEDGNKEADFFRLNKNIQNEELRVELTKLRKEFELILFALQTILANTLKIFDK